MGLVTRLSVCSLVLAILVGCASTERVTPEVTPPAGLRSLTSTAPPCAVTPSNKSTPIADWGAESLGNGSLWTLFWRGNTVLADPSYVLPDGSVEMKWPWWRAVPGQLAITGRRLDAPAPPLSANIAQGYGDTGFQPSSIHFP